uniref:Uncharacterized protein n=1 Tax=Aegilops tauschii subsp. strangulata TaxID=200361 RepID=A0A453IB11_AEGTS
QSAFKDPVTGKVSAQGRLASGFGAGVLEALVIVTPFEVVKIRLQQQKGLSTDLLKYKGPIHCAKTIVREEGIFGLWSGASPTVMRNGTAGPICTGPFDVVKTRLMAQGRTGDIKYKGMFHAIRTIHAEEGLRALWKGLLPRLMRIPPGQAIMWTVADQVMGLYERTYLQSANV